jgi:hypothetical protein
MRENATGFPWENNLRGLIGDNEEEKLANLRAKVADCRVRRCRWSVGAIIGFVTVLAVSVGGLWIFPAVGIEGGADVANWVIGLLLALWAFFKRWLPSLDHHDVNETIGKVVPRKTFEEIVKDAHGSLDLDTCVPLLAALAIFAIRVLNMISNDPR